MLTRYANPRRFVDATAPLLPWLAGLSAVLLGFGLYLALVASPADYQQGEFVRIMYVHVPAAWMALGIYAQMAVSSALFLSHRHPLADLMARASAPIGAVFAFLTLLTGSLWGQPMWGTWWAWDARLTSMLLLFFVYLGYLALSAQSDRDPLAQRACAIVSLTGALLLPVIKFSVEWWHTLHQPASLLRLAGPAIDPAMLAPLLVMGAGYLALFAWLLCLSVHARLLERQAGRPGYAAPVSVP